MKIKAFGIARDIFGGSSIRIEGERIVTVGQLRDYLLRHYPEMAKLKSMAIAVDQSYAADETTLTEEAEIVVIPPVSGG
jgi:molybdopterin synthase sulfur carrier subunit